MQSYPLKKLQYEKIIKATFPEYHGRKVRLIFLDKVTFHDTNWGDGSKNSYACVKSDGKVGQFIAPAPWDNPVEGKTFEMKPDLMVVCHSIFCGVDVGITVYAHPANLPKWLEG
jgi:hypothetical protein